MHCWLTIAMVTIAARMDVDQYVLEEMHPGNVLLSFILNLRSVCAKGDQLVHYQRVHCTLYVRMPMAIYNGGYNALYNPTLFPHLVALDLNNSRQQTVHDTGSRPINTRGMEASYRGLHSQSKPIKIQWRNVTH